jgi:hypothetical protein
VRIGQRERDIERKRDEESKRGRDEERERQTTASLQIPTTTESNDIGNIV